MNAVRERVRPTARRQAVYTVLAVVWAILEPILFLAGLAAVAYGGWAMLWVIHAFAFGIAPTAEFVLYLGAVAVATSVGVVWVWRYSNRRTPRFIVVACTVTYSCAYVGVLLAIGVTGTSVLAFVLATVLYATLVRKTAAS